MGSRLIFLFLKRRERIIRHSSSIKIFSFGEASIFRATHVPAPEFCPWLQHPPPPKFVFSAVQQRGRGIFQRPLVLPAPLFYCWFVVDVCGWENSRNIFGGSKCFFVRASKWDAKRHRWSNPTRGLDTKMDGTFSVALYIASQEHIVRARGSLRISLCHDQQPWWCTRDHSHKTHRIWSWHPHAAPLVWAHNCRARVELHGHPFIHEGSHLSTFVGFFPFLGALRKCLVHWWEM